MGFDDVRAELRRAVWWSRVWALAYTFYRSTGTHRVAGQRVALRPTRTQLSSIQGWRVHRHEKAAWARLEELTS